MSVDEVVAILELHDVAVARQRLAGSPTLLVDIQRALPRLDASAQVIAVQVIAAQPAGGASPAELLLSIARGDEPQAAVEAARAVGQLAPIPADGIITSLPRTASEMARAELFKSVGDTRDAKLLDRVRPLALQESDEDTKRVARAALAKLGGQPERQAFFQAIQAARPDEVKDLRDELLYVNEPVFAKALLSWMTRRDNVMRLGGDRQQQMIRMCDLGAWTAYQLGVKFALTPAHLTNFEDRVLADATRALQALPELK